MLDENSYFEIESWDADKRHVVGSLDLTMTNPKSRDELQLPQDVPITFHIKGVFDFVYDACDM